MFLRKVNCHWILNILKNSMTGYIAGFQSKGFCTKFVQMGIKVALDHPSTCFTLILIAEYTHYLIINIYIKYAAEFQCHIMKKLCMFNFIKGNFHSLKRILIFIYIIIPVSQNYIHKKTWPEKIGRIWT